MLKQFLIIIILSTNVLITKAQSSIDSAGYGLEKMASLIQNESDFNARYFADSSFTKQLVGTLKNSNSYNYKFEALKSIQKIIAPDNTFKIFSWQLDLGNGNYKQRAAIQIRTDDGSLKLLPFFDHSEEMVVPEKEFTTRKNWVGAIYYDIILTQFKGVKFYTLLGYDEYNNSISRKIIEVIHFENGEPVLGGDYFEYPSDETFPIAPIQRFVYYYKKGSNANISYDKLYGHISISELTSTSNDLNIKNTLVPSGNELYFKWKNGKWIMSETNE